MIGGSEGPAADAVEFDADVQAQTRRGCHVVIVTYNSARELPLLLEDLAVNRRSLDLQVCVVDNGSQDGTQKIAIDAGWVRFIQSASNLGYAGGINTCMAHVSDDRPLVVLNPDVRLQEETLARLLSATDGRHVGVAVPQLLDSAGHPYPSLRKEPSLLRAAFDALLGSRMALLPGGLSEMDWHPSAYAADRDVAWATGAAFVISPEGRRQVSSWDDEFFLYSEETDYCRRIRDAGLSVRFVSSAKVVHAGGASGASADLTALMAVNRVRYYDKYHSRPARMIFQGLVMLHALLRCSDPGQRRVLRVLLREERWAELPGGRRRFAR